LEVKIYIINIYNNVNSYLLLTLSIIQYLNKLLNINKKINKFHILILINHLYNNNNNLIHYSFQKHLIIYKRILIINYNLLYNKIQNIITIIILYLIIIYNNYNNLLINLYIRKNRLIPN